MLSSRDVAMFVAGATLASVIVLVVEIRAMWGREDFNWGDVFDKALHQVVGIVSFALILALAFAVLS